MYEFKSLAAQMPRNPRAEELRTYEPGSLGDEHRRSFFRKFAPPARRRLCTLLDLEATHLMSDPVTAISVELAGLTIALSVIGSGAGRRVSIVVTDPSQASAPAGATSLPAPEESHFHHSAGIELGAGSEIPEHLLDFVRRIGAYPPTTAADRIRSSYNFGCADRHTVDQKNNGERAYQREGLIKYGKKTALYVVLRPAVSYSPSLPVWTRSYQTYLEITDHLAESSVSRAFASQAEASAYCYGAGLNGLPYEC